MRLSAKTVDIKLYVYYCSLQQRPQSNSRLLVRDKQNKTMIFLKYVTAWFQIMKTLKLLLMIILNLAERENAPSVSTIRSRFPQFANSLQCRSSGQKHNVKILKTEVHCNLFDRWTNQPLFAPVWSFDLNLRRQNRNWDFLITRYDHEFLTCIVCFTNSEYPDSARGWRTLLASGQYHQCRG